MIVRSSSSFDFTCTRQACGPSWDGYDGVVTGGEGVGGIRHLCALKSAPKSVPKSAPIALIVLIFVTQLQPARR